MAHVVNWQMKLNKESWKLITFIAQFGRYIFNMFPVREKYAKNLVLENLRGIKNVFSISDDTIV